MRFVQYERQMLQVARFPLVEQFYQLCWVEFACEVSMQWAKEADVHWLSDKKDASKQHQLIHWTNAVLYTLMANAGQVYWIFIHARWHIFRWKMHRDVLPICNFSQSKNVQYGADLEWLALYARGQAIRLDQYLQRDAEIGYDCVRSGGVDWPILLELRPQPVLHAMDLIESNAVLLRQATARLKELPQLTLLAGAYPQRGIPLGGHIHLQGVVLTQHFVRALDWMLIVPLSAIEPVQARCRRPRFGRLGDVRVKPDGHFEYRTLPNWMVERELAQGLMTLLPCVVRRYLESGCVLPDDIERSSWWQFHFAYYHGGRSWFQQMLPRWWEMVLKMITTEQERKVLDFLYERIRSGRHWQESINQISLWDFEIV